MEGPLANLRHRGRNGERGDFGAAVEGTFANLRHSTFANVRHSILVDGLDLSKRGAVREGPRANTRHRVRDGDLRERGAVNEGPLANLRH